MSEVVKHTADEVRDFAMGAPVGSTKAVERLALLLDELLEVDNWSDTVELLMLFVGQSDPSIQLRADIQAVAKELRKRRKGPLSTVSTSTLPPEKCQNVARSGFQMPSFGCLSRPGRYSLRVFEPLENSTGFETDRH